MVTSNVTYYAGYRFDWEAGQFNEKQLRFILYLAMLHLPKYVLIQYLLKATEKLYLNSMGIR